MAIVSDMPELPFPDPPLGDGEITLRPWRDEDVAPVSAWGRDPTITRWTDVPLDYTEPQAREWAAATEEHRRAGRGMSLMVVDARTGELLGSCDLRRPTYDPLLGEIGFLVDPNARGRGVAVRALALLIRWGFDELGMRRIQALVHPDNPASLRVVERLGFAREGLLRSYREGRSGREDRIALSLLSGELGDFGGGS
jgi:RimJ/RimL family protein N-acetyltransferase